MKRIVMALAAALALATPALAQQQSGGAGGSGGTGCVVSGGAQYQILANNGSGGCLSDGSAAVNAGAFSLGASGTPGSIAIGNASSGTITIESVSGPLGSAVASLPANTGTLAETNLAQTFSAAQTFAAGLTFSGLSAGTAANCLAINGGSSVVLTSCGGGSGGVTSVGTGNGLTGGPITSSGTISPTFYQVEITASCAVLATSSGCTGNSGGDMAYGVMLGGSGATLTLSAKAAGLWQPGQSFAVTVDPAATGNWTLTNSSTLTLRGLTNTTALVPGESLTFVADADGSHLDVTPGVQTPTTGAVGGVYAHDCTGTGAIGKINSDGTTGCVSTGGGGGGGVINGSLNCPTAYNSASSIAIKVCQAADTTDATEIATTQSFYGSTGGAWTSGAGSSGLPVNKMGNGLTVASGTWYYVCLANNGGTADFWFDTSASCANRPSGITDTKYRVVSVFETCSTASCGTASTSITKYYERGSGATKSYVLDKQALEVNNATYTASPSSVTLSVPPGFPTRAYIAMYVAPAAGASVGLLTVYDAETGSVTNANGNLNCFQGPTVSTTGTQAVCSMAVTAGSGAIDVLASQSTAGVNINTQSYDVYF